jgi:hypothetical protein
LRMMKFKFNQLSFKSWDLFFFFVNWHEVSTVFTDDFVLSYVPYLLTNNNCVKDLLLLTAKQEARK